MDAWNGNPGEKCEIKHVDGTGGDEFGTDPWGCSPEGNLKGATWKRNWQDEPGSSTWNGDASESFAKDKMGTELQHATFGSHAWKVGSKEKFGQGGR